MLYSCYYLNFPINVEFVLALRLRIYVTEYFPLKGMQGSGPLTINIRLQFRQWSPCTVYQIFDTICQWSKWFSSKK